MILSSLVNVVLWTVYRGQIPILGCPRVKYWTASRLVIVPNLGKDAGFKTYLHKWDCIVIVIFIQFKMYDLHPDHEMEEPVMVVT